MTRDQRAGDTPATLDLAVLHRRPGAVVAQRSQLVVAVDLSGLGLPGGHAIVNALAAERLAHPRPAPVVNLTIVGENAPRPDAQASELGRQMGEHMSVFVCVMEGSSIRRRWVRGVLAGISVFAPRRSPMFLAASLEEGARLAAHELDLDPAALAAAVARLRRDAGP